MMESIVQTLKKADNEGARAPYWLILDPVQNMNCDIFRLAGMITGPFFSRTDAQEFLTSTRYNFSKRARVFCSSGHNSKKYMQLLSDIDSDSPLRSSASSAVNAL